VGSWSSRHDLGVAVGLGLVLEAVPVALAVLVGPPAGFAIGLSGFVVAWAVMAAGRRQGRPIAVRRAIEAVRPLAAVLVGLYALAMAVAMLVGVAALVVVGSLVSGPIVLVAIAAAIVVAMVPFAYVVPCLVDGDDVVVAVERARILWGARGSSGMVAIAAIALAGLGPAAILAIATDGLSPIGAWAVTLFALALAGPIMMLGLERLRPRLERAARHRDPGYGRP
jgi:hypothetical protein